MPLSQQQLDLYNHALRLDLLRYRWVRLQIAGRLRNDKDALVVLTEWLFRAGRTFTTDEFCGPGDLTERCRKCMWCMRHIKAKEFLAEYPPPEELLRHWDRGIRIATITRLSGNPATTWNAEVYDFARRIKIKR